MYFNEGLPGVLGNKRTLANFWEQGNKIRKITVRKHSDIRNREHYLFLNSVYSRLFDGLLKDGKQNFSTG